MARYITGRLFGAALTLAIVVTITLAIFYYFSSDPASNICGQTCTESQINAIRENLGLDDPFFVQVWEFTKGLFVGRDYGTDGAAIHCGAPCIGRSFQTGENVLSLIATRLPVTITLALGGAFIWLTVGVTLGAISAMRPNTVGDRASTMVSLLAVATPNYFLALVLQYVLVVKLKVLPFPILGNFSEDPINWLSAFLMPWFVLSAIFVGMYARLTRTNILDARGENYYRAARAKGIAPSVLFRRHGLRPALTPVATLFGYDFAQLLGGALITETVFGLNGVGKLAHDAISSNDQPVIMGVTLVAAFAVIFANLIVDIISPKLDPRIVLGSES